jgi:Flp pilus assembly secretin CpaC
MNKNVRLALIPLLLAAGEAAAQEAQAQEKPRLRGTPLKLTVVYARYQGEKKVASVPYTLTVNADEPATRLRMGVQVPIATQGKDGVAVQYRDVGNNIDCNARTAEEGRFKLSCTFEQSSLYSADGDRKNAGDGPPMLSPMIRNFRSEASLTLRDGQTVQHTAATDPVSGEVIRIDVTLNIVK